MPNSNTLKLKCFYTTFNKYNQGLSIDPFARNCKLAKITNDLNRNTSAKYHMYANEFLLKIKDRKLIPDVVIFDPPFSLRQVKECYDNYGSGFTQKDSTNAIRWTIERDIISNIQISGGIVHSFGWTTTCMSKKRGYEILEIVLCSHGPAHNDTIMTVERKI